MSKIRLILNPNQENEVDRLVEMATEFRNGPKDKHDGSIRIDGTFKTREELEGLVTYLQALALDMPLPEKGARKTSKSTIMPTDQIEELIKTISQGTKRFKGQEDVLEYLRSLNFILVTADHWVDICKANDWPWKFKKTKDKRALHTNWVFMVRIIKIAKDPANDKYDPQIAFGFKLIGDRIDKIQVYRDGKWLQSVDKEWNEKGEVNFKVKEKFYKFPAAMNYDERAKWRTEDRKALTNPDYVPSKFYYRWKEHVTILAPLRVKK